MDSVYRYRDHGNCPVCNAAYTDDGSSPISYGDLQDEGGYISQKISCSECNHSWIDWYKFDGISYVTDEDGDEKFEGVPLRLPDFENIVHNLLKKKELLPLLLRVHEELDKLIEKKMRG